MQYVKRKKKRKTKQKKAIKAVKQLTGGYVAYNTTNFSSVQHR